MTDGTTPRALDPMGALMGGGRLRTPRPFVAATPPSRALPLAPSPAATPFDVPSAPIVETTRQRTMRLRREAREAIDARVDAFLSRVQGDASVPRVSIPEEVRVSRAGLTLRQKILVATVSFSVAVGVEDIAVACWRLYPETFALRGHPTHVDTHKVYAKLSGIDGVCALGWLRLVATRTYEATPLGRIHARALLRAEARRTGSDEGKEAHETP